MCRHIRFSPALGGQELTNGAALLEAGNALA
jgi:hypothetical protein